MSRIAKVDPAQATGRPKELLDKVQAPKAASASGVSRLPRPF